MKQWWEECGVQFECQMCGKCCGEEPGSIWVSEPEMQEISEFLKIDRSRLRKLYLVRRMGKISINEKENFDCVFLDEKTRKCGIYSVRPAQCRSFPFWDALMADKNMWDFYSSKCPGMDCGKHYTPEMVKELLKQYDS